MSLLNTRTGFTTPWHCAVALMADGEWFSGPAGDFKEDARLEIVYEDGKPSYFRERAADTESQLVEATDGQSQAVKAVESNSSDSTGTLVREESASTPDKELRHAASSSASSSSSGNDVGKVADQHIEKIAERVLELLATRAKSSPYVSATTLEDQPSTKAKRESRSLMSWRKKLTRDGKVTQ